MGKDEMAINPCDQNVVLKVAFARYKYIDDILGRFLCGTECMDRGMAGRCQISLSDD